MKPRTILTICIAVAVFVPVAQATAATKIAEYTAPQSSSTRAELIRGDALNRRYHLGAYRQTGTRPTVAELRAMTTRGDALNRKYGLGAYATGGAFLSDVASSDAVARFQANAKLDRSDAVSRFATNLADDSLTTTFSSDVANSSTVARHQALGRLAVPQPAGDSSVFRSPAIDTGIAAGLLLVSLAGFMLARSRSLPGRPA